MGNDNQYLLNTSRPGSQEMNAHDELIRDAICGDERMRWKATQYVRRPEGLTSTQWNSYLRGAPYINFPMQTLQTWAGAINRKQHTVDCPVPVRFKINGAVHDEQLLIKYALQQVLSMGRITFYADPEGYVVAYGSGDEVEMKCEGGKLVRAIFQEETDLRLELHLDADGWACYRYLDNENEVTRSGDYLIVEGKTITWLPIVTINAWDLAVERSLSPLYDICRLSTHHWDLSLSQSHALWYCGNPQPVVFGITSIEEVPKGMGPSTIWSFANPQARAEILTYSGPGISDRREEIRRVEQNLMAMGAQIMLSRSNAHTVARTQEMITRQSTSDLVEVVKNVGDGLTMLLRHLTEFKGKDLNAVKVTLNTDILDAMIESNMVRALNDAYGQGLLSFNTWHLLMQRGEIIPESVDAEDEKERIATDPTLVRGQPAKDSILDGGDGLPNSDEKEEPHGTLN